MIQYITPQSKKEIRKQISLEYTSDSLGFLHAALIEIDNNNYLLAGPSGIGKSTFSNNLNTEFKASVFAKDWVAVEKEGNNFYASDLNFSENLSNHERCLLSGVIFLTRDDQYKRDAFVPNREEFANLLKETFDTEIDAELKKLSLFWTKNESELPFLCAIPARRGSESTISKTLVDLLKRQESLSQNVEVGVIGVGSIGVELAFQLGQLPYVHRVHLYNRSQAKAIGYTLDLNQSLPGNRHDVFVAHTKPEGVFISSSSVFLSFRNESNNQVAPDLPERWQKLSGNLKVLDQYAQTIGTTGFNGTLFLITNPVDVLTYALYQRTQGKMNSLRTYQVYGIGLEVDAARALYYGKQIDSTLTYDAIRLFGNHSDDFVLETPLTVIENGIVLEAVKGASKQIRNHIPRTTFGPVGAAIRSFRAFQENGQVHITAIQEDAHIGRKICFQNQLPMLSETIQNKEYQSIIENNKHLIAKHLSI